MTLGTVAYFWLRRPAQPSLTRRTCPRIALFARGQRAAVTEGWSQGPTETVTSGPDSGERAGTGGWSTAMAAKSWMRRLRRVASQARHTWLGGMSLTWL